MSMPPRPTGILLSDAGASGRCALWLICTGEHRPHTEAEYWLRQAESDSAPQDDAFSVPDLAGHAEIALARGQTEVGLGLWRSALRRLPEADSMHGDGPGLDPWALEIQSAAVTAHAHAGRLHLLEEPLDRLRQRLHTLLSGPSPTPRELPVFGTVLHALGTAYLASGDASAVRMIALAERLRVLREFQPTMSATRARQTAEDADRTAYAAAVSTYAALGRDELREAARALLSDHGER